jgi:hypothetical protein
MVTCASVSDPTDARGVHMPWAVVDAYMGEYGLSAPDALDAALHVVPAMSAVTEMDPCDDPAVVHGWVTTTDPDAEPVQCYTARSTRDAGGAFLARIAAHKADRFVVTDPDGLLSGWADSMHDPARRLEQCERADLSRWFTVYGELPVPDPKPVGASGVPLHRKD